MSQTIYISRKCEHCHELLILLHKNRDIFKFPIVDVHTNPYPKSVTSVPCMIIDNKILPGEELFKYLNYMIQQKNKKDDNGINNDLMPPKNNMEGQKNMGPMHNGNPMNLNMSSSQKNLNVPGNVNNDVQNIMSKMDTNENTMMPN